MGAPEGGRFLAFGTVERSKTKTRITGAESPTDLVELVDKISLVSALKDLRVTNRKEA